jgi:voltage-gated potassium channel
MSSHPHRKTLRDKLHHLIFASNTKVGHRFEVFVTWAIILSVVVVVLETVEVLGENFIHIFMMIEWGFTVLFTLEYMMRLYAAENRWKYATSFFGIIDLISILPAYVGLCLPGKQSLLIIRILRLLRLFRIFKMGHFVSEGAVVASALRASKIKIIVFLSFVSIASIFMGALMYMVESDYNTKIQNIPEGIYWAIVTMTTVGYGDAIPITPLGKVLASVVMVLGYGIIAVPTGIVTAEITNRVLSPRGKDTIICSRCEHNDHLKGAHYCHKCGESLR